MNLIAEAFQNGNELPLSQLKEATSAKLPPFKDLVTSHRASGNALLTTLNDVQYASNGHVILAPSALKFNKSVLAWVESGKDYPAFKALLDEIKTVSSDPAKATAFLRLIGNSSDLHTDVVWAQPTKGPGGRNAYSLNWYRYLVRNLKNCDGLSMLYSQKKHLQCLCFLSNGRAVAYLCPIVL